MATLVHTGENIGSRLMEMGLTKKEFEWLESCVKHHSYFRIELDILNNIKAVYLMDASNAPELSEHDRETYNFERRAEDEGVKKVKLNKKAFNKFWNKYLLVGFNGMDGIVYVKSRKYEKFYRCRPFGWVIEEFNGAN